MADFRHLVDQAKGEGMAIELYELALRKDGGHTSSATGYVSSAYATRQVRIVLDGGGALLEPGALQYAKGRLKIDVQKAQGAGGLLRRQAVSAGTGESAFTTRYSGTGEVWTEPTRKHFILASMDGPDDALILDDGAFYACEGTVELGHHIHRSVSGVLSGNGLVQPKLTGRGVFIVESPVPVDEIEAIELDGSDELIVDGDVMLMYSAALKVELRPLVSGLRNAARTGEGLVFRFSGTGTVWLTPTAQVH